MDYDILNSPVMNPRLTDFHKDEHFGTPIVPSCQKPRVQAAEEEVPQSKQLYQQRQEEIKNICSEDLVIQNLLRLHPHWQGTEEHWDFVMKNILKLKVLDQCWSSNKSAAWRCQMGYSAMKCNRCLKGLLKENGQSKHDHYNHKPDTVMDMPVYSLPQLSFDAEKKQAKTFVFCPICT